MLNFSTDPVKYLIVSIISVLGHSYSKNAKEAWHQIYLKNSRPENSLCNINLTMLPGKIGYILSRNTILILTFPE